MFCEEPPNGLRYPRVGRRGQGLRCRKARSQKKKPVNRADSHTSGARFVSPHLFFAYNRFPLTAPDFSVNLPCHFCPNTAYFICVKTCYFLLASFAQNMQFSFMSESFFGINKPSITLRAKAVDCI